MNRLPALALFALVTNLAASEAAAVPPERGFGLGVETTLLAPNSPAGALDFVYDLGQFRFDGLFGLAYQDTGAGNVSFLFGARFFYVLHSFERADLSIGFGAAIFHGRITAAGIPIGNRLTRGEVDALAQIRVFLVDNVSLNASLGMGVGFGDGGASLGLGGQLTGVFGLTYYFQ